MTDAYEIGIQLALQDDVSGGLAVIKHELDEVDRAIQATSAHLLNLGTNSQSIQRSTATAIQVSPAEKSPDAVTPLGVDNPAISTVSDRESTSPTLSPEGPNAPAEVAPSQLKGTTEAAKTPETLNIVSHVQDALAPNVRNTTDTVTGSTENRSDQILPQAVPTSAVVVLPYNGTPGMLQAKSPVQSVLQPNQPDFFATSTKLDLQRSGVSAQRSQNTTISSIPRTPAPSISIDVAGEPDTTSPPSPPAFAPTSGEVEVPATDARELSPGSMAAPSRASAPQPRAYDGNDGMTGTVMLDGHLVGYWLAEQLARDASRPPGGTSFFDPRQTPAWIASGSL